MPSLRPFICLLGLLTLISGTPAHAQSPPESLAAFQHVAYARLTGAPGDVSRLALDSEGFLWMRATRGSVRFDGARFRAFPDLPALLAGPQAQRDTDGNVWTVVDGLLQVQAHGQGALAVASGAPASVQEVVIGSSGRVYVTTAEGIRFYRRHGTALVEIAAPLIDRQVNGLMEAASGSLWATRTSSVLHASRDALDAAERTGKPPVMETFPRASGLSGAFPHPLLEDRDGNVWVGTEGGVDVFRRTAFTAVPLPEGIHEVSSATDRDGNTWVGSDNHPILHVRPDGTIQPTAAQAGALAMVDDARRNVGWAANDEGLWRLSAASASRVAPNPFPAARAGIPFLAIGANGDVIAAPPADANSTNAKAWDGAAWRDLPPLLARPVAAATDASGVTWLALAGRRELGGLEGTRLSLASAIAGDGPRALAADEGGLWVGGDRGVQFFDGTRYLPLPLYAPELLHWVTGIVVDDDGYLWVETSAEVYRSREPHIARDLAQRHAPVVFDRFDFGDGIPGAAHPDRGLPSLRKGPDGLIRVETVAGLAWIDPAEVPRPRPPSTPRIDEVTVHGVPHVPSAEGLRLKATERDISIGFATAELSHPDRIRYAYRLDDGAWVDTGEAREVFLANLPAGASRFELRAIMDGQPSASASLRIVRESALQETTAFKALVALGLVLVVAGIAALRMRIVTRRLRIRAEEREAVARDIHDTLLQRVQGVMLSLQSLADRRNLPASERAELRAVAGETQATVVEARERIQGLRGQMDEGLSLYDHILAAGEALAVTPGPVLEVSLSGQPRPVQAALVADVVAIATEAMRNATMHAKATHLNVVVSFEPDALWLTVSDDGRGMSEAEWSEAPSRGHFGIVGMKERAATIGGTFQVDATPGEGTEIHVRIPAKRAYA
ncbi:two-component regulator propeller domain-containing protein [Luteibacter sp.]|uniref:sensor histidine kinase n=1 Tax=Luteibacter sp. TaxID=1886636 RepID=UPI003F7E74CF